MAYCENCGQQYSGPKNYCRKCGQTLAASTYSNTAGVAQAVEVGVLRAHGRITSTRRAAKDSNESLELYLKCIGVIAFIHGLSFFLGPSIQNLLNGAVGWLLAGGIILAMFCKTVFDLRCGNSLTRSLLGTVVAGVFLYGAVVGSMWYFSTYIHGMAGKPPLELPKLPTPTAIPKG